MAKKNTPEVITEQKVQTKYERKMECKILEGKMEILNTVQKNFENMFTPKAAMQ